jgi:hypothetical protein
MRRQVLDLSWIVATGEDEFDHDALAREHRLRASRAAAIQ